MLNYSFTELCQSHESFNISKPTVYTRYKKFDSGNVSNQYGCWLGRQNNTLVEFKKHYRRGSILTERFSMFVDNFLISNSPTDQTLLQVEKPLKEHFTWTPYWKKAKQFTKTCDQCLVSKIPAFYMTMLLCIKVVQKFLKKKKLFGFHIYLIPLIWILCDSLLFKRNVKCSWEILLFLNFA